MVLFRRSERHTETHTDPNKEKQHLVSADQVLLLQCRGSILQVRVWDVNCRHTSSDRKEDSAIPVCELL